MATMPRDRLKTILLVCTGNVCRSPMAAAIMSQRILERGLAGEIEVRSAGVWAGQGYGASEHATTVLAERGLDLRQHVSRQLTLVELARADIVLVMEEAQRRSIFHLAPEHLSKVFLLAEMAGRHDDVADPYGGPIEGYGDSARQIERLVDAGLPQILTRLGFEQADTSAA